MASGAKSKQRGAELPIIAVDMPVMYEDEGQDEMGDTETHTDTTAILHCGVMAHLADRPEFKVFSNLNLYYHPIDRKAYVSPDLMVVCPARKLRARLRFYRVGKTGPAPVLTGEVLSRRSFQQQDLTNKPGIYADLGVSEYVLVDVAGEYLPAKLLLKRLHGNRTWKDEQDADGGVTSRLGFRLLVDTDGRLRVIDVGTGRRYLRPDEAEAEAEERQRLEAEVTRLRRLLEERNK